MIITSRSLVNALTSAPTTITARLTTSIRRLPKRSPSRPMMGVATAPDSRVEVRTQVASAGAVSSSRGRSLTTGTSRVCITATTMPAKARTGTTAAPALPEGRAGVVCVMKVPPGGGTARYVDHEPRAPRQLFRCFGPLTIS